ncbi:hypothetical protein C7H84_03475 [Burkholderia sp. Nafp2/4-1b]|nr:hypothetical protein C7H84_03475 [Burkholderia sp. Nafp2/4-1b]
MTCHRAGGRAVRAVPRAYACPRAWPAYGIRSHARTQRIRAIVASFHRMNDTANTPRGAVRGRRHAATCRP